MNLLHRVYTLLFERCCFSNECVCVCVTILCSRSLSSNLPICCNQSLLPVFCDIKSSITSPGSSRLSLPSVSHHSPHLVLSVRMTQLNNEEDQTRTEFNSTLSRPSIDVSWLSQLKPWKQHDYWPFSVMFFFLLSNILVWTTSAMPLTAWYLISNKWFLNPKSKKADLTGWSERFDRHHIKDSS